MVGRPVGGKEGRKGESEVIRRRRRKLTGPTTIKVDVRFIINNRCLLQIVIVSILLNDMSQFGYHIRK